MLFSSCTTIRPTFKIPLFIIKLVVNLILRKSFLSTQFFSSLSNANYGFFSLHLWIEINYNWKVCIELKRVEWKREELNDFLHSLSALCNLFYPLVLFTIVFFFVYQRIYLRSTLYKPNLNRLKNHYFDANISI